MPAVSKKQQKFFGIVRAIQKGEMAPTTPETAKAAADMKKKDVKDFASTKHKGLPDKKIKKEENDNVFDVNDNSNDCDGIGSNAPRSTSGMKEAYYGGEEQRKKDEKKKKIDAFMDKAMPKRTFDQFGRETDRRTGKLKEESNPRIPRKKGQPANSKKHSDLYTDENPKGTIHGLGFKDVATAKASVSKIRNSSRSHAHKIQAAVAMEQRAREMGKSSEAAVYRKYINSMKKKTKKMNEGYNANSYNKLKEKIGSAKKHREPAVEEKENGRCKAGQYYCYTDKVCKPIPSGFMVDPAGMLRKENGATVDEGWSDKYKKSINCDNPKGFSQRAHCQGRKKKTFKEFLENI